MIDKALRQPKETVLMLPSRRWFHSVHPTTITLAACVAGIAAALAVGLQS